MTLKGLIVLPTYNAEPYLEKLLDRLQGYPLLIIDSSSKDKTVDIAKKYNVNVQIIKKKDFNHSTTRNLALQYTSVDFYLFITQDILPRDDSLIQNLYRCLKENNAVVSYARQLPYPDASPIESHARYFNYPSTPRIQTAENVKDLGILSFFNSNSCSMYDGEYFRKVGGFTKELIVSEDMEFAARALRDDQSIVYCPEAIVFHSHYYNQVQLFKRYFDIGTFFSENKWIEDWVASKNSKINNRGMAYVRSELTYLIRKRQYSSIPYSLISSFTKYIAFRLGRSYRIFPKYLLDHFSNYPSWHINSD